jgi:hypothetical protein
MLNTKKAFSSFSVNDIPKAKEFYGKTLGLELSSGPEGTLGWLRFLRSRFESHKDLFSPSAQRLMRGVRPGRIVEGVGLHNMGYSFIS